MTTQVRKNVMDMFIDGARRGFTIATTNLLPNVVMAFVIIQALKNYRSARLGRPYLPARDGAMGASRRSRHCTSGVADE
ncbi:membrane protein [Salmonella bongori]|nr:membrane protein [Salmonella bongori]